MGNCLRSSIGGGKCDKMIKVMRMDGKILKYNPPLVVRDLVNEKDYGRKYMVADPQNVGDTLPDDYELKGGVLYYLIPSHVEDERSFNGGMKERGVKGGENGMTIKILVSKTELKALLSSDGCVKEKWVEDFLLKQLEAKFLQLQQRGFNGRGRWRPALEKIIETN